MNRAYVNQLLKDQWKCFFLKMFCRHRGNMRQAACWKWQAVCLQQNSDIIQIHTLWLFNSLRFLLFSQKLPSFFVGRILFPFGGRSFFVVQDYTHHNHYLLFIVYLVFLYLFTNFIVKIVLKNRVRNSPQRLMLKRATRQQLGLWLSK